MTTAPVKPNPVAVVNAWAKSRPRITAICAKRISYRLDGVYPAIRLADIGPQRRGPEETLHRVQIECWADDYDTPSRLARTVEAEVESGTLIGTWVYGSESSAYCSGGAVESGPYASPDETSNRYRHQLDIVLWLYPVST